MTPGRQRWQCEDNGCCVSALSSVSDCFHTEFAIRFYCVSVKLCLQHKEGHLRVDDEGRLRFSTRQ